MPLPPCCTSGAYRWLATSVISRLKARLFLLPWANQRSPPPTATTSTPPVVLATVNQRLTPLIGQRPISTVLCIELTKPIDTKCFGSRSSICCTLPHMDKSDKNIGKWSQYQYGVKIQLWPSISVLSLKARQLSSPGEEINKYRVLWLWTHGWEHAVLYSRSFVMLGKSQTTPPLLLILTSQSRNPE